MPVKSTRKKTFSNRVARHLFEEMLTAGIPFSVIVPFLLRYKCGLNMAQIAELAGLEKSAVYKQMQGKNQASLEVQNSLKSLLGFNPFSEAESILGYPVLSRNRKRQQMREKTLSGVSWTTTSDNPAESFIDWVRDNLSSGNLPVNRSAKGVRVLVHILDEGVFLVSPAIFKAYLNADNNAVKIRDYKQLQKRLERLRLNIKTNKKMNIHNAVFTNGTVLHGFLFPHHVFYTQDDLPPINRRLTLKR